MANDTAVITQPSLEEIQEKFRSGEITGFINKNDSRYNLYISGSGKVCFNKGKSKTKGFILTDSDITGFTRYIMPVADIEKITKFRMINKFRKYAEKSQYTNAWIDRCVALPDTYEKWKADGEKSLYDYDITTGSEIDGKVISVETIKKEYPQLIEEFFERYYNDEVGESREVKFQNLNMKLSIYADEKEDIYGRMSLTYKNGSGGYYYNLINLETFIGINKQ